MRYGIQLGADCPTDPGSLVQLARGIEELPFQSLWLGDHIIVPQTVDSEAHVRAVGGSQRFADRSRAPIAELFTTLAYLAAVMPRIRLGMGVLIAPLRHPVLSAKMISNLDRLSDGRLDVGVGVGWIEPEFAALGAASFKDRGRVTDEYLDLMVELWTADVPSFVGRYAVVPEIVMWPKPVQRPHPPIWIGGNSAAAMHRAARIGQGWMPLFQDSTVLGAKLVQVGDLCEFYGRPRDSVRVAVGCRFGFGTARRTGREPLRGSASEMRDDIKRYADLGIEEIHLVCATPDLDIHAALTSWERFATEVLEPA
jgi:probable F420-dependent oxidoreductase